MKWWSGKRIMISKERDFGVLLGALIRELPDVFEAEVLTKLSVKDHLALAQVNKECKDVVYSWSPSSSCGPASTAMTRLGAKSRVVYN